MNAAVERDGNVIAWIRDDGRCENAACRKAVKAGRTVHITPADTDPRAAEASIVLPEYHFTTSEQAEEVLEASWAAAIEVSNRADRDAAYARHVPVKVRKDGDYR